MTAATSTIQIWTLVVAGLAVVSSIAGIVYTATVARKSEHEVWQRDLRVRIYGECTATAEEYITLLASYVSNLHVSVRTQGIELKALEHLSRIRQLRIDIRSKVDEVQTFGAAEVSASAVKMCAVALDAEDTLVTDEEPSLDITRASVKRARVSLSEFRSVVRRSLKISND